MGKTESATEGQRGKRAGPSSTAEPARRPGLDITAATGKKKERNSHPADLHDEEDGKNSVHLMLVRSRMAAECAGPSLVAPGRQQNVQALP